MRRILLWRVTEDNRMNNPRRAFAGIATELCRPRRLRWALLVIAVKSEGDVPGPLGTNDVTEVGVVRPGLRGRRRTHY
jgi:hypothetical protein